MVVKNELKVSNKVNEINSFLKDGPKCEIKSKFEDISRCLDCIKDEELAYN